MEKSGPQLQSETLATNPIAIGGYDRWQDRRAGRSPVETILHPMSLFLIFSPSRGATRMGCFGQSLKKSVG